MVIEMHHGSASEEHYHGGYDEQREAKWVVRSPALELRTGPGEEKMQVFVPPHPVIRHFLSVLRNEVTPSRIFWGALAELGRYLIYEAARDWLSTVEGQVKTPCGVAKAEYLSERDTVKVVPILRAGLVLIENMHSILPFTQTYHIGYAENDNGKEPTLYLNKFPDRFPEGAKFLIADAMLATGACLRRTIDLLKRRNVDHRMIRVVSAVATPEALRSLNDKYPGLRVYIGSIDEGVDERGHIVPGIGDVESRCFGS